MIRNLGNVNEEKSTRMKYIPTAPIRWLLPFCFLLAAYVLYRLSIYVHAEDGEVFKSIFDIYTKDTDVFNVVQEVARLTGDTSLLTLSGREQLKVACRYNSSKRC